MAGRSTKPAEALLEQSAALLDWLAGLTATDFSAPSILPGWDVGALTGHLVVLHTDLLTALGRPTRDSAVAVHEWVRRCRRDAEQIQAAGVAAAAGSTDAELVAGLRALVGDLSPLLETDSAGQVLATPSGAVTQSDLLATRVVELVVHADDLSRSCADRPPVPLARKALAVCSRTLTAVLAGQHPGRSVEVRIPPFAAVQCGIGDPGPTHTRGTPPNVVELDALTFARLATGRTSWAEAMSTGRVSASGLRADLSAALPLLS